MEGEMKLRERKNENSNKKRRKWNWKVKTIRERNGKQPKHIHRLTVENESWKKYKDNGRENEENEWMNG